MTKLMKNRKRLLYLIAIAVMVAIMSIACKNKPTQIAMFIEEPTSSSESETPTPVLPTPEPDKPTKPDKPEEPKAPVLKIDKNKDIDQFLGKYFQTKEYDMPQLDGTKFRYTVEVIEKTSNGVKTIWLELKGYSNGGKPISRYFQRRVGIAPSYNNGQLAFAVIQEGGGFTTVKFTEEGYLYLKPTDFSWEVKFALVEKK